MWKWIKNLNPFAVQLRNTEARLEFARVLLAHAEIELADKAFYVREFAAVSQERDNYKSMLEEEVACGSEYLERAEALGCPKDGNINDAYAWALDRIAALRERASVPVKVRWDVTAPEAADWIRSSGGFPAVTWMSENKHMADGLIGAAMRYLAAHAVIDAPAGVPSVQELVDIGFNGFYGGHSALSFANCAQPTQWAASATAIRDAVLAGVAAKTITLNGKTLTAEDFSESDGSATRLSGVPPTDDQVEALARVLHKSQDAFYCRYGDHATKFDDHTPLWSTMARAAIAHLSKRPEGLPTADQIKAAQLQYVEGYRKGENDGSMCASDFALEYMRPWLRDPVIENELLLVPAGCGAHGRRAFVNAHPNIKWNKCDEFTKGYWSGVASKSAPSDMPEMSVFAGILQNELNRGTNPVDAFSFVFTQMKPWLRDPVGFELDVTVDEIYTAWYKANDRSHEGRWQAVLDLCRSRIRPVYECKECAKIKGASMAYIENIEGSCRSARAALEGE